MIVDTRFLRKLNPMIVGTRFMRKYRPILEEVTNLRWLFTAVTLSAIAILVMFLHSISKLHIGEAELELQSHDQVTLDTAKMGGRILKVGLSIRSFLKFDMTEDLFEFDGILWFEGDPRLLEKTPIDKFYFDRGKLIEHTELPPQKDRRLFKVRARVQSNLEYRYFPLDDHRLDLVLKNVAMTAADAVLTTDLDSLFVSSKALDEGSWKLLEKKVRSGFEVVPLRVDANDKVLDHATATPEVVFSLDFKRKGLRPVFIIFVPLFFIFFLGLASLTLDPTLDFSNVLALSLASLTSLLYYQMVVQGITPRGDYFTLSDRIYTLLLIISTATFLLLMLHMHQYWKWKGKTELPEVLEYIRVSGAILRRLALMLFLVVMLVCLLLLMP